MLSGSFWVSRHCISAPCELHFGAVRARSLSIPELSRWIRRLTARFDMDKLENICYAKNYITQVIFRVDYSTILKINEGLVSDFQALLSEEHLFLKPRKVMAYKTTISPKGRTDEERAMTLWDFADKEGTKKLSICSDFFVIEIQKYDTFENLRALIEKTFPAFLKAYSPVNCTRMGLRFINEIKMDEGNPLEWEELVYVPLGHLKEDFFKDKSEISRIMGQTILTKEDHKLTFNYGIFNSEFPAKISRKEFILDFDCYTEIVSENEVVNYVGKFHREIQELFEMSIKDRLREIMETQR